jgi:hypothetical protein
MGVAAAASGVALGSGVAAHASSDYTICAFKARHANAYILLSGTALTPRLCRVFNSRFHGIPGVRVRGKLRCLWSLYVNHGLIMAGGYTRTAVAGRVFCRALNPGRGWKRIK